MTAHSPIQIRNIPLRRSLSAWAVGLALTLGALGAADIAQAQSSSQTAADQDREGREAFSRGEFAVAARAFEEASRLDPHSATRYNAALAWDQAHELARAADAYEMALAEGDLDQDRASASRARLIALQKLVGTVVWEGPIGGTVSVDHVDQAPLPARVHLLPGPRSVRIRFADGTQVNSVVSVRAGEVSTLNPTLPAPTTAPAASAAPGVTSARATGSPTHAIDDSAPTGHNSSGSGQVWGWGALTAAGALSAAAIVLGVQTLKARDQFDNSDHFDADARDRALSYRAWTNVAWGAAAICGVTGLGLVIFSGSSAQPQAADSKRSELRLGLTSVSATLRF
jgi:hypothetical protein